MQAVTTCAFTGVIVTVWFVIHFQFLIPYSSHGKMDEESHPIMTKPALFPVTVSQKCTTLFLGKLQKSTTIQVKFCTVHVEYHSIVDDVLPSNT